MDPSDAPKIVVLALGNLIRSDDAIGLFALRHLEEDPRLPPFVSLVEGGTKGLELVPYICDASCLLVLDAVDVGATPGTVFRIAGEDLRSIPGNGNVHELALADILNALRMMGYEPKEIVLLGVQPLITELGTVLSIPVLQALPALVEAAVTELCRWGPSNESSVCEAVGAEEKGVAIPALEG
ncbi:MAG: hydrogenase maturation protease [Candidatus Acidiferrales bacterium]